MQKTMPEKPLRNQVLENVLQSHQSVKECLVLSQHTPSLQPVMGAYVVTTQAMSAEDLKTHLNKTGADNLPEAYVFLNALPLTAQGDIDFAQLTTFPVVDKATLQHVEDALEGFTNVRVSEQYAQDKDGNRASTSSIKFQPRQSTTAPEVSKSDKPALVEGPSLDDHTFARTLQEYLLTAAEDASKGIHFVDSDGKSNLVSYDQLLTAAKKTLAGLNDSGVKAGDKVIVQIDNHQEFLSAFWACVLGNITVLPMAQLTNEDAESSQVSRLLAVLDVLGETKIISDTAGLNTLNKVLPDEYKPGLLNAQILSQFEPTEDLVEASPESLALLLLTSGSTGTPKLVTQTHEAITSRSFASALMNDFNKDDVFLNWFPLDHVGGIVMFHMQALAVGASQIQAPMGRILHNPLEWLSLIEQHKATVTWAPNFAYSLVNKALQTSKDKKWDLSSMRFILNGGEAICAEHAHTFLQKLAPHGLAGDCMHPSWGMSETCSGIAFSDSVTAQTVNNAEAVVVGEPIAGVSFRIVDESRNTLKEGEVGTLLVKGTAITKEYYGNPHANEQFFTADGWFSTGDKAVIAEGQLTITGREKDVVIINGLNHSCGELEMAIEEIAGVRPSSAAAVGIRQPNATTDQLAIFFTPEEDQNVGTLISKLRRHITQRFSISPDFVIPLQTKDIPVTSIGKIQRSVLKQRFEAGEYANTMRLLDPSSLLNKYSFQPRWQLKNLSSPLQENQSFLILTTGTKNLDDLEKAMNSKGQKFHIVEFGSDSKDGSEHLTIIDGAAADTQQKLEELINKHQATTLVDARSLSKLESADELAQQLRDGCQEIINLATLAQGCESVNKLVYCSSSCQQVTDADTADPTVLALTGMLKAAQQESANLQVKHLDLDTASTTDNLVSELIHSKKDTEVAYRQGQRFVKNLQPLHTNPFDAKDPIAKEGLYVITGGLGGIGAQVAKALLQNYDAKVLLLGRTEMPARHLWQQYLEDGLAEAGKIKTFKQLQSLGKDRVLYASGDVADNEFVTNTLEQAAEFFKTSISGIFHLAGAFEEKSLSQCDENHLRKVIDAKAVGAWNLYQFALQQKEELLFVTFSSANGYFSGPNGGAYSAANSFLDAMAQLQSPQIQHHCFAWSMWDDLGMSEGYVGKELTEMKGYKLLKAKEGLEALWDGLTQSVPNMIVGIDGNNPSMQSHIASPVKSLKEVKATYESSEDMPVLNMSTANSNFVDALGHRVDVHFESVSSSQGNSPAVSSLDVQGTLAKIWQDVLDMGHVEPEDNFFDLGGHSLIMIKVQERIKQDLNLNLEMVDLFKFPTLNTLAEHIAQQSAPQVNVAEGLASIWADVLEYDNLEPESNFFDLGGHSLLMIQVREKIKEKLNKDIEMIELFKYPTLQALTEFLEASSGSESQPDSEAEQTQVKRTYRRR